MSVAVGSNVCSSLVVGIAGLNPAESMDVLLLCLFCVVKVAASDDSFRRVIPTV